MNAQIICVGTELLLGDTVNTNATDISRMLAGMGVGVYRQLVVGDNAARLSAALAEAFSQCDVVFMTGGLGPTYDDLTKQTAAGFFGKKLVMNETEAEKIRAFYRNMGIEMPENNLQQAMMPEDCIVLENPNGTAPGCIIEGDGKAAVLMPGPPREMRPMLEGPVRAWLEKRSDKIIFSRTLNFFGIGESSLEKMFRPVIEKMENPTVAPYAKTGEVQLRITASAKSREECLTMIEPVERDIRSAAGKFCYGTDYHSLQEAVVTVCRERKVTVSTVESCTGGLVASMIVEIPGASEIFGYGAVTYWNEAKESVVGVSSETLEKHTAVSRECALEMARGVKKLSSSDIAVSTTGYAGPGENAGLVYVAAVGNGHEYVRELHLARGRADDREQVRRLAAMWALRFVLALAQGDTDFPEEVTK